MTDEHQWTKLTSLSSKYEADLLAGRLKETGIRTRTERGRNNPAAWLTSYGGSAGPFDLYVPAEDAGAARELVGEINSSELAGDDRSFHRPIQVIGRVLILAAILALVATFIANAMR